MNNFAEEDFMEERDDARAYDSPEMESHEDEMTEDPASESFFQSKWIRVALRGAGGLVVIGTALSLYWSRIPDTFDVEKVARRMAVEEGHRDLEEELPRGYRTTSVTIHMAKQLLEKPGGYLSNDWSPMSRIPDNMRNWEYGYVVQLRVLIQGLRYELSRSGPQSSEHKELREAEAKFNFTHDSLILPSTESQYKEGIRQLEAYLENISNASSEAKYFAARQDQVIRWLERQKIMLGDYASKMQNNVGEVPYDTGVLVSRTVMDLPEVDDLPVLSSDQSEEENEANSFFERDDAFYQVRGGVYVMYHCMLAMRRDCEELLNDSKAMGIMNRVLNELESACKPMKSPMVLNGREFGVIQNHSLTMSAHLAKAHLAVQELQKQISGGGN